jgi:hypothetical protein
LDYDNQALKPLAVHASGSGFKVRKYWLITTSFWSMLIPVALVSYDTKQ